MKDSDSSPLIFFIAPAAEKALKPVNSLKTAQGNLSLDFKSLIQYNDKAKPFFRSRYETKHNN